MRLSSEYLAGLIDGEGSFVLGVGEQRKGSRIPFRIGPILVVGMVNEEPIKSLQETFECGTVRLMNGNFYRYQASSIKDISSKVIPLLDTCPLIAKAAEYNLWREAVLLLSSSPGPNIEVFNKVLKIKRQLESLRSPRGPRRGDYRELNKFDIRPIKTLATGRKKATHTKTLSEGRKQAIHTKTLTSGRKPGSGGKPGIHNVRKVGTISQQEKLFKIKGLELQK